MSHARTHSIRAHAACLAVLVLLAAGGSEARSEHAERRPQPLAHVAGQPLTADEFVARYGEYLLRTGQPDALRLRLAYLEYRIDVRLVAEAAREAGIERDAAYRRELDAVRQKLLLDAYAERRLFDTIAVAERDLRDVFVRMNTQLTARHLYARTRAEAETLYARVRRGERFEDLAREVFADSALAHGGGSVGTFTFDEMDPAFEDAAFALDVGEVSEPVRTTTGYSVIQLLDRTAHPLLTEEDFAAKKEQLRIYTLRRKRSEALFRHARQRADALDLRFDEGSLDRLAALAAGTALLPEEESQAWLRRPLVTFSTEAGPRTWSIAEFRERALFTTDEQRARVRTRDGLEALVAGLVVREQMLREAREAGYDREPAYARAVDRAMELWTYRTTRARLAGASADPGRELPSPDRDAFTAYVDALRARYDVRIDEAAVASLRMPI